MMDKSIVYLIPSVLDLAAIDTIPESVVSAIKNCQVIFAENERTARRFFKSIWSAIVIDDYEWYTIHNAEDAQLQAFRSKIAEGKNVAIISEAGCPGIADPGQILVNEAQKLNVTVKPLVGPCSIILALMASGMNGQQFQFVGYLPIDMLPRAARIKELEEESAKKKCTQIFIETPYRNNQLIETLLKTLKLTSRLCIACDLTAVTEIVKTRTVAAWRQESTDFHKRPVIFLIQA